MNICECRKESFRKKTMPMPNGCIHWTGSISSRYGHTNLHGKHIMAHRMAWTIVGVHPTTVQRIRKGQRWTAALSRVGGQQMLDKVYGRKVKP